MIHNFNRHIHQIWFQNGNLEQEWDNLGSQDYFEMQRSFTDFCKEKNWKYTLWREETITPFVRQYFPEYFDEFTKLDSIIKKVDCARLMILYIYGGMYVDIDSYLKRDLDEFLNLDHVVRDEYAYTLWHINPKMPITHTYDLIAGQEKTICEYHYNKFGIQIPKVNNAVLFCRPGLDLFLEVIEKGFRRKNHSIMNSFGVQTFSNTVYNHMRKFIDKTLETNQYNLPSKILTLPFIYFYEMDVDQEWYIKAGGLEKYINDPRQYIVHKFDGIWDGEKYEEFLNKLTNRNITKY